MKELSKIIFGLGALFFFSTDIAALPNAGNPITFTGPTAKIGFTGGEADLHAYSLALEGGRRTFRLGGTFGLAFSDNQRIKASAEYLAQDISYGFFTDNSSQWVKQGALGADYQYDLGEYTYLYNPQINFGIYLSHAPSQSLEIETGTFINKNGELAFFTDNQRVAGSNAIGINPGFTFYPWNGADVGLNLNYDNVRYDNTFRTTQNATGFGGTIHLNQIFEDSLEVGASAAVRQPFNLYQAHVTWLNVPFFGNWLIGAVADYTIGKETLPSTYMIGLSIDYLLAKPTGTSMAELQEALNFLRWGSIPAIHMPQVLAVPNEQVTTISGL